MLLMLTFRNNDKNPTAEFLTNNVVHIVWREAAIDLFPGKGCRVSVKLIKFQKCVTTKSLLLASTSSNVLLGRSSEKSFNECLGVSNVFPSAA